jgi:ribosomal protein L22
MSAEKPTDEQPEEGQEQANPAAEKKPPVAKKPAPKKESAEKSAAAEKSPAKRPVAKAAAEAGSKDAAEKPARAAKTTAKKASAETSDGEESASAKKPATKKPVAKGAEPVAEAAVESKPSAEKTEKKPTAAKAEESTAAKTEEPVATEAKKPATATRPKSAAAPSGSTRKVVRAQARYVRTSARKARMVCGHLRGKSVDEARAILAFTPREVARDWSKLLESAVANAENNHELIEDDLLVREAYADEGPTIKRFRPRAQGRATPIRKRTSHLTITLTPKP